MSGIEERLRQVEGVAGIELELGDEGLKGIKVKMEAGGDEAVVLDEIRRILTAYGLRSRREGIGVLGAGGVPETPRVRVRPPAGRPGDDENEPVRVRRTGDGLQVELRRDGRTIIRRGEATPLGAASAMVAAAATERDMEPPRVRGVNRVRVGDTNVLVLVVEGGDGPVVGASVLDGGTTRALWAAVDDALRRLAHP